MKCAQYDELCDCGACSDDRLQAITLSLNYISGHARGLREGRDASNVYEQDFAYQHEDYTRGYWDGFRVGINETRERK